MDGDGRLDTILAETPIPQNFDFLSIDIDGCDWHIWNSLTAYRPKVVCIEFNPTIPNCVPYIQPGDFSVKHGNGPRALCNLADQKGHVLVAATACNLFFVDTAYADAVLGDARPTLDALRREDDVSYVFSGFNGEVLTTGPVKLTWHGLNLGPKRLQVLPASLHHYPDDYTFWQKLRFKVLRRVARMRFGETG